MIAMPSSALISEPEGSDGADDGMCASRPLVDTIPINNNTNIDIANNGNNQMRMDFSTFMSQGAENCDPQMRLPQPKLAQKANSAE